MAVTYDTNLIKLIREYNDEAKCRSYLESLRWPKGVTCPRCAKKSISRIHDRDQYDCDACRYQFSVTAGTIMHDTHLPLWKWFLAVYMIVESKKAISANQISRTLDIAYRTSWYLCHRIRKALFTPHALLMGIVEVDETYVGGKVRGKQGYKGNKAVVVGAVQRKGKATLKVVDRPDKLTLRAFVSQYVSAHADAIFTDENSAYGDLKNRQGRRHEWVTHSKDEWVRGDVHTNSVESAWSLFKRGLIGAYHKVSKKHLDKYLDEFEFRFNNRDNPFIFRDALRELLTSDCMRYAELVA